MDNHKSHHSYLVKDTAEELGFEVLCLPVATSELNPIERVWSLMKRKWASVLYSTTEIKTREQAMPALEAILDSIPAATITKLARNDISTMIRYMLKERPGDFVDLNTKRNRKVKVLEDIIPGNQQLGQTGES